MQYNKHAADDQAVLRECQSTVRVASDAVPSTRVGTEVAVSTPPKLQRNVRARSPAKPRQSSVARSTPYDQKPKAAELKAAMHKQAMRWLFKESYPTQEIPDDDTLKKHWDGSNQSDREACINKVTEEYEAKRKVTIVDDKDEETFEEPEAPKVD